MLGKWVRFDNKIPVDGISWTQGFPIPKILGVQAERYFAATRILHDGIPSLRPNPRDARK